ncbi:MAG: hypothetical protein H7256_06220 [Bdellovibrio sp.]|nr:hypothetical protein [Bdellovibrio sp.]
MICPNCQSDVVVAEKDFGALFNCPKCQTAYFLNFDGAPEYSNEPPPDLSLPQDAVETSEPLSAVESADFQEVVPSFEQPISPEKNDFPTFENNDFASFDQNGDAGGLNLSSDLNSDVNSFSSNEAAGVGSLLDPSFGESAFSNVASDISNFGNSETQITSLNYDLKISGLDTREDLLAFKEMIEDSRFAWDVSDLMKQIKGGTLFLPRLNPVRAYILAKRLHFLDLELKWKQNVLE